MPVDQSNFPVYDWEANAKEDNMFPAAPGAPVTKAWNNSYRYQRFFKSDERFIAQAAQDSNFGVPDARAYINVPIPKLVASYNAAWIFGEQPNFKRSAPAGQEPSQNDIDRMNEIIKENKLPAALRRAARITSSQGGVYCKVYLDPTTPRGRKVPKFQFVEEWNAIPEFDGDELTAVTFFSSIRNDDDLHVRLAEIHEPGVIRYKLYRSKTRNSLGYEIPLTTFADTAHLANSPVVMLDGIDELDVVYIPNRENDLNGHGESDLAGVETLLFAGNQAMTLDNKFMMESGQKIMADERLRGIGNRLIESSVLWVKKLKDRNINAPEDKPFFEVVDNTYDGSYHDKQSALFELALSMMNVSQASMGKSAGNDGEQSMLLKMHLTQIEVNNKAAAFEDAMGAILRVACLMDTVPVDLGGRNVKPGFKWDDPAAFVTMQCRNQLPRNVVQLAALLKELANMLALEDLLREAYPNATDSDIEQMAQRKLDELKEADAAANAAVADILKPSQPAVVTDPVAPVAPVDNNGVGNVNGL